MTNEGVFPKTDGDILFPSETNRFASAGQFIATGSFVTIGSQTATQDFGSVVITAGSLSNPFTLYGTLYHTNAATRNNLRIMVSGVGVNRTIVHGSGTANRFINFNVLAGSPFNGALQQELFGISVGGADGNRKHAANTLNDLDPGSDIVILFTGEEAGNSTIESYNIQSFRGTV